MIYALCALVVIVPLLVLYAYRLGEGSAQPRARRSKMWRVKLPRRNGNQNCRARI